MTRLCSLLLLGCFAMFPAACSSPDQAGATTVDAGAYGGGAGSGQGGGAGAAQGGQAGAAAGGAAGAGQGGAAGASQGLLPGDELSPWEGGPSYYGAWSAGPSTEPSFFPIAVWLQAPDAEATAQQYKAIGVNVHIGLWNGPTEQQLAAAAALPTSLIADQNPVGLGAANNGSIKAWMHQDEPDNAQDGTQDPVPPQSIIDGYKAMVAADATRPVYLNLGQGAAADSWYGRGNRTNHPEDYPLYAQGADILSFDIYPMNVFTVPDSAQDWKKAFHNTVAQNIWYVADGVKRLRAWSDYKKPVWVWIETTNFGGDAGFALTPQLVKAEVWMALIHGARGIGYFCHVFSPSFIEAGLLADPAMKDGVHAINAQLLELAPVLNTQSVSNGVTTVSSEPAAPVDTMVKRHAGFTYLFAVGMRPAATTATFTLRSFSGSATVEVVGEGRSVNASDGVFQDAFSGHAVHIFRVANPGS